MQNSGTFSSASTKLFSDEGVANTVQGSQSEDLALNNGANWRWFHENPGRLRSREPDSLEDNQTAGLEQEQTQDIYSLRMNIDDNSGIGFVQPQDESTPETQNRDQFETATKMHSSTMVKGQLRHHILAHMRSPKARGGIIVGSTASTSSEVRKA